MVMNLKSLAFVMFFLIPSPMQSSDESWRYYRMEDNSRLKFEALSSPPDGPLSGTNYTVRLFRYPENGAPDFLWERNGYLITRSPRIAAARRFGNILCIVIGDIASSDDIDYLRIDMSRSPYRSVYINASTNLHAIDRPPIVIENEFEYSYQTKEAGKVLFHVYEDGRVDRNGVHFPTHAIINGKDVGIVSENEPAARRVWPPQPSSPQSGGITGESPAAANTGANFPGDRAETGRGTGRASLWIGLGVALLFGGPWLFRRVNRQRGK